jgi:CRISPR-associated protein Cas1
MDSFTPSDLKVILHSKRANIFVLEHCRIVQKDGRVLYLCEKSGGSNKNYFNIPVANTTCILLGNGTSITQAAVRVLCQAGVMLGFCGGGGTPLYMGSDVEWFSPQSEYRPTEYLQGWVSFWFDDKKRLNGAKFFQKKRVEYVNKIWPELKIFNAHDEKKSYLTELNTAGGIYLTAIEASTSVANLLLSEARYTRQLYAICSRFMNFDGFKREFQSEDAANSFLNQGNYLAYGLAATCLWVLGIPHGLALMHGKTRRGALVFDVADLIKDAVVLPVSFACAGLGLEENEFRQILLQAFIDSQSMDWMFSIVEAMALKEGSASK